MTDKEQGLFMAQIFLLCAVVGVFIVGAVMVLRPEAREWEWWRRSPIEHHNVRAGPYCQARCAQNGMVVVYVELSEDEGPVCRCYLAPQTTP